MKPEYKKVNFNTLKLVKKHPYFLASNQSYRMYCQSKDGTRYMIMIHPVKRGGKRINVGRVQAESGQVVFTKEGVGAKELRKWALDNLDLQKFKPRTDREVLTELVKDKTVDVVYTIYIKKTLAKDKTQLPTVIDYLHSIKKSVGADMEVEVTIEGKKITLSI